MFSKEEQPVEEETTPEAGSASAFFAKIAGEDMEVDAKELQEVLNCALKRGKWLRLFSLMKFPSPI